MMSYDLELSPEIVRIYNSQLLFKVVVDVVLYLVLHLLCVSFFTKDSACNNTSYESINSTKLYYTDCINKVVIF